MNGDEHLLVHRPADDVREAVHATCRRLYAVEDEFVRSFRVSLAHLVPELRHRTDDGGEAIAEGLARAVLWAGLTSDPPDVVEVTFQNVGAEYSRRGFPHTGYHGAGHALLRAARDIQIADWTSELSSAWVAYYGWLSAHLTAGAGRSGLDGGSGPAGGAGGSAGDHGTAGGSAAPLPAAPPPAASPPAPAAPAEPAPPSLFERAAGPAPTPRPRQISLPADGRSAVGAAEDTPAVTPATLDEVLHQVRSRYFAGNERALGAILTRVALRTGADLRAPRPDQRANPAVIANVVAVLEVMGYLLQPDDAQAVQRVFSPPSREAEPNRWWSRRRSASVRGVHGTIR